MYLVKKSTSLLILAIVGYSISSSLLTPTDLVADANFHMGSIYCQTKNSNLCSITENNIRAAFPPQIMPSKCQNIELKYKSIDCQNILNNTIVYEYNLDQYPDFYYKLYSNFVIDRIPIVSIFIIRLLNALPFVIMALLINFFVGKKFALGFSLGHMIFSGIWGFQFYFTFNPSSWLLLGITSLPLFLGNLLHENNFRKRIAVIIFILFSIIMVLYSRPDGKYWLFGILICFLSYIFLIKSKNSFSKLIISGIIIFIFAYSFNIGLQDQFIRNIEGFTYANSYSDNYEITKMNLIVHNILMLPLFLLSFFGFENSLENVIPSLLYTFPIFIAIIEIFRNFIPHKTLRLLIIQIILFSCAIIIFFSLIDYLLIYDKRIGTRYFFPLFLILLINTLTHAVQNKKLQYIKKIKFLVGIGTTSNLLLNIKKAHEGFNSGIYFSLNSDFFNLNNYIILLGILIFTVSFMYIINFILLNISNDTIRIK